MRRDSNAFGRKKKVNWEKKTLIKNVSANEAQGALKIQTTLEMVTLKSNDVSQLTSQLQKQIEPSNKEAISNQTDQRHPICFHVMICV